MKKFPSSTINVGKNGCPIVLGELENIIMDTLWELKEGTVQEVRKKLSEKRVYSFNTIMTVMNILVEKDLLNKNNNVKPYTYSPKLSKENFFQDVAKKIVKALMGEMRPYAISSFTDELDKFSEEDLKRIKQRISSRLNGN